MYKALLCGVLSANKCKTINFPWNEHNVDQLFPIPRIARMPMALVRPRKATQKKSGDLSSLAKPTAFLQATKGCVQAYAGPCPGVLQVLYTLKTTCYSGLKRVLIEIVMARIIFLIPKAKKVL